MDEGDDWGDTLAGFDIGDLSLQQRQTLSTDLAEAGILHAFIGAELQGPAAESERIERLAVRREAVAMLDASSRAAKPKP